MLFLKYLTAKIESEANIAPINIFLEVLFGKEVKEHVFNIGINNYSCYLLPIFNGTIDYKLDSVPRTDYTFADTQVIVIRKHPSIFKKILYFFQNIFLSNKIIKKNYTSIDVYININNKWKVSKLDLQSNRLNLYKNIVEIPGMDTITLKNWLLKNFEKIKTNMTFVIKNCLQDSLTKNRAIKNNILHDWRCCNNIYELFKHIFEQPLAFNSSEKTVKLKQTILFDKSLIFFFIEDYKTFIIKTPHSSDVFRITEL